MEAISAERSSDDCAGCRGPPLRMQAPSRRRHGRGSSSYLAGKLFDEAGERLTTSHAVKGGRRYRYYVSRPLVTGTALQAPQGWRLPALEIERIIADEVGKMLSDRSAIAAAPREAGIDARGIPAVLGPRLSRARAPRRLPPWKPPSWPAGLRKYA